MVPPRGARARPPRPRARGRRPRPRRRRGCGDPSLLVLGVRSRVLLTHVAELYEVLLHLVRAGVRVAGLLALGRDPLAELRPQARDVRGALRGEVLRLEG